jgi:pyruvate/2-oxoglutarate dehydrogenase complex dihydrolipoamide acyltransferase (E2) component
LALKVWPSITNTSPKSIAGIAALEWQLGIALRAGVAGLDQGHTGFCRLAELVQHARARW